MQFRELAQVISGKAVLVRSDNDVSSEFQEPLVKLRRDIYSHIDKGHFEIAEKMLKEAEINGLLSSMIDIDRYYFNAKVFDKIGENSLQCGEWERALRSFSLVHGYFTAYQEGGIPWTAEQEQLDMKAICSLEQIWDNLGERQKSAEWKQIYKEKSAKFPLLPFSK